MSIKSKLIEDLIVDETMNADITSESVDIGFNYGCAIAAVWSGTPAGNLIIQSSIDGTTWFTVSTTACGGVAGSKLEEIKESMVKYVRVFFDFTSSTGTLNAKCHVKGV